MKQRIYIAGKVIGENEESCKAKFTEAKKIIEASGFTAINPLEVVQDWKTPWNVAMKLCIAKLCEADAVITLPCWSESRGAKLEKQLALIMDIPVFPFNNLGIEALNSYKWNN